MIIVKKALFFVVFFSGCLNAKSLYNDLHQIAIDFSFSDIEQLQQEAKNGNIKSKYLIASHMLHNEQKKEEGVKILEELAAADIVDAKYSLYMASSWVNVEDLTEEKAIRYLKDSAQENYAESQVELARAYITGKYVKKDLPLYHYWIEKAAEQGHADALIYTASDYYIGRGVNKDEIKGFQWLMRAYNLLGRNFIRWGMLGHVYENGLGTSVDLAKAYMCYDLDGTAGIEDKARIAPHMTPEQRAEGLRLSQEWQEKNHVYTMQSLGLTRQKDGSYQ